MRQPSLGVSMSAMRSGNDNRGRRRNWPYASPVNGVCWVYMETRLDAACSTMTNCGQDALASATTNCLWLFVVGPIMADIPSETDSCESQLEKRVAKSA